MTKNIAIMSDGASIAWQIDGPDDAPTLLLSNSLGTDHTMWDNQLTDFTKRYRVLRYDTRGHGQSDAPHGAYGLDRLGLDVLELLDALKIDRISFCGVSLGGMTGQWLGVHASNRIDRVVLANTAAYMGPPSSWQTRIDTVLTNGMRAITDGVLDRWFTPEFLNTFPDKIQDVRYVFENCKPQGYAGCCAAIRDMDQRPVVGLISCPTLIISGLRDPATPPAQGEALAAAIPGARHILLDAAHLSNIEQSEEFNEAVLNFLD
ncbi:3-oxoadipate enol-lactonase [Hyphococcus lacteus]|uniref:3-oxoadipate enol-lactonase n=1 Tax=Hyphococcus lacteus TaxID=3143536 RepID=A0ABV3Z187_9PROT